MAFRNMRELADAIAASGQNWSDADRALAEKNIDYGNSIYTLKNDWTKAMQRGDKTAAQDIHDRTDDFRRQYGGYTGGADGSGFVKDSTYFNYDDPYADTLDALAKQLVSQRPFQNPYQEQTDKVLDQYLGRGPFEYDLDSDINWRQYQKTYLREGQRAREDTLANYAAATGGQSSTAAVNAASQAQDYYNAQMADKIPELYQFAYERWLNEGQQYAGQLDALRGLGADALNAYSTNLGLLNSQLSGIKNLSDTGYDRAYNKWQADYGVKRDSVGDTRYEDETAYNRAQDAKQQEQDAKKQALAQALEWMQLGIAPDSGVTSAAGLTPEEVQSYIDAVRAQMVPTGGSGGGRSGGSGSGSRSGSGSVGQDYDGLFAAAKNAGSNAKSFIANNYKKFGFSSQTGLLEEFEKWSKKGNALDLAAKVGGMMEQSAAFGAGSSGKREYGGQRSVDGGSNAAFVGVQNGMQWLSGAEQKVAYIEKALGEGRITEAQARQLMKEAGL